MLKNTWKIGIFLFSNLFNPKTFKNLLLNTCKSEKKLLSKNLCKTAQERTIYKPPKNLPVGNRKEKNCPSGRPPGRPAQRSYFWPLCLRSTAQSTGIANGRPTPTRECGAFSRSTARSTDRAGWPFDVLVHIGRPIWSITGLVDRQCSLAGNLSIENLSF